MTIVGNGSGQLLDVCAVVAVLRHGLAAPEGQDRRAEVRHLVPESLK